MPLERPLFEPGRGDRLARLVQAALWLESARDIPAKLGLRPADWHDLLSCLETGDGAGAGAAATLATLHRAMRAAGAESRYFAAMEGVRFPLSAAGVAWQRELGPISAGEQALERALAKLRLERWGLYRQRRVSIASESVSWAIAGLLPTGATLALAVQVRPAPDHLGAMREDLADDAVAAAGFAMLGFRDWQLRYPGACALHVAGFLAERATGWRPPAKLDDPDDDHPVHRLQASPARLTPREASPQWALREALRRAHPGSDRETRATLLRAMALDASASSAEGAEWPVWG